MKITLINTGKTLETHIINGVKYYQEKIQRYIKLDIIEIFEVKANKVKSISKQKEIEGESLLKQVDKSAYIIVLDEKGIEYSSIEFADHLQKIMNKGIKNLTFITGGAYGFSKEIYDFSHERISLSRMTFPHQLVRLIFIEQLYRAITILKHEPYHHI